MPPPWRTAPAAGGHGARGTADAQTATGWREAGDGGGGGGGGHS